jgi:hypothetical protein
MNFIDKYRQKKRFASSVVTVLALALLSSLSVHAQVTQSSASPSALASSLSTGGYNDSVLPQTIRKQKIAPMPLRYAKEYYRHMYFPYKPLGVQYHIVSTQDPKSVYSCEANTTECEFDAPQGPYMITMQNTSGVIFEKKFIFEADSSLALEPGSKTARTIGYTTMILSALFVPVGIASIYIDFNTPSSGRSDSKSYVGAYVGVALILTSPLVLLLGTAIVGLNRDSIEVNKYSEQAKNIFTKIPQVAIAPLPKGGAVGSLSFSF